MSNEQNLFSALELPGCLPLAMAYVPMQHFGATYAPEAALAKGTLFPELDKPFLGRTIEGGCRRV